MPSISKEVYNDYIEILKEELVPALGCTEPIAIAYASAKARKVLWEMPTEIIVLSSGNMIKNVKGVVVPMSGDMRGIETAAVLGAVGGNPDGELEVLKTVTEEDIKTTKTLVESGICTSKLLDTKAKLHIIVTAKNGDNYATVEIIHTHTGIVRIEKNGEIIFSMPHSEHNISLCETDRGILNIADIFEFANTVKIDDIKEVIGKQIEYNSAISEEGIANKYGANVGMTLVNVYGDDIKVRAKAKAAAGSDARMSGCVLPVVINSGSGNQGMTVSIPVIEYWKELKLPRDMLYRALALSNLVAIHQKTKIGRLSAYCGAVSAAAGAGAGITYLYGGDVAEISMTITNTLANVAGIVCDGAKPSCAAKIASSVDAAIMAHNMAMLKRKFNPDEGIVKKTVEETINRVSQIAREGMAKTDSEILKIMTE